MNLKAAKKKDTRGHVFPTEAMSGQVLWFEETPRSMIGRMEYLNGAAGTTRSFSCANCPCGNPYYSSVLSPTSVTKNAGDQGNFFTASYKTQDCSGNILGPYSIIPVHWTATGSAATVNADRCNAWRRGRRQSLERSTCRNRTIKAHSSDADQCII